MKATVALLALCALLAGTVPRASAENGAETARGPAKGPTGEPAPPSGGSPTGPAASSAPGDHPTRLGEPEGEDAPSPPEVDDPLAGDSYETGDEGNAGEASSLLAAPESRDAHDDPEAADPDADPLDTEGD